jgi:hypothetical protein
MCALLLLLLTKFDGWDDVLLFLSLAIGSLTLELAMTSL